MIPILPIRGPEAKGSTNQAYSRCFIQIFLLITVKLSKLVQVNKSCCPILISSEEN